MRSPGPRLPSLSDLILQRRNHARRPLSGTRPRAARISFYTAARVPWQRCNCRALLSGKGRTLRCVTRFLNQTLLLPFMTAKEAKSSTSLLDRLELHATSSQQEQPGFACAMRVGSSQVSRVQYWPAGAALPKANGPSKRICDGLQQPSASGARGCSESSLLE